jgi:DNA-binding Lrp family transcriptional regulator
MQFKIPPKPRIYECVERADGAPLGAVRYSILPARAVSDPRLTHRPHLLLLLASICLHTSPLGICYPSQRRLAKLCRRSPSWVSRYIRELEGFGYLKRLVSQSKRKRHAHRRIVIYEEGAPLPPLEQPEPMPWAYPFNGNQPEASRFDYTPETVIAAINVERETKRIRLDREAWQIVDYFAEYYGRLYKKPILPTVSLPTARNWINAVGVKSARKHIEHLLTTAKHEQPAIAPSINLKDYPAPRSE